MWGRLLRWAGSVLVLGVLWPAVHAQAPTAGLWAQTPSKEEPFEPRPPVFEFALAFLGTGLILLILCMPSRKR